MIRTFTTAVHLGSDLSSTEAMAADAALGAWATICGKAERALHAELSKGRTWTGDLQTVFYRKFGIGATNLCHVHKDLVGKRKAAVDAAEYLVGVFADKIDAKSRQIAEKQRSADKLKKSLSKDRARVLTLEASLRRNIAEMASVVGTDKRIAKIGKALQRGRERLAKLAGAIAAAAKQLQTVEDALHQHKRKLAILEADIAVYKVRTEQPSICFGSRELFARQNHLKENGYASLEEWQVDWRASRSAQVYVEGNAVKDCGNEFVRAKVRADRTVDLEIRLPPVLAHLASGLTPTKVPYVRLTGLSFNHGHDDVLAALADLPEAMKRHGPAGVDADGKVVKPKKDMRKSAAPVTWRFMRDLDRPGRWFVSCTVHAETPEAVCDWSRGGLGVDLNVDHVAVTLADRFGNPVKTWRIPLGLYGKSTERALQMARDVAKTIAKLAKQYGVPVVSEKLDFAVKKARLTTYDGPRRARMLSSFAYSSFDAALHSACRRAGVWHSRVNPAYTSLIGLVKFARRYGLSVHLAAALSIARRGMGHSERLSSSFADDCEIAVDDRGHVALSPPARMEKSPDASPGTEKPSQDGRRHVWKRWGRLSGRVKAARAARSRASAKARDLAKRLSAEAKSPARLDDGLVAVPASGRTRVRSETPSGAGGAGRRKPSCGSTRDEGRLCPPTGLSA